MRLCAARNARLPAAIAVAFCIGWMNGSATAAAPLSHVADIPMPGVKGRIDHFAVDRPGHRLFVAALGNDTVEVIDTAAKRHIKSMTGFGEPQGIAYVAAPPLLFVANGGADRVDVLDGRTFAPLQRIADLPDADNVRFDAGARQVIVGYGNGALKAIDVDKLVSRHDVKLSAHPESFQVEQIGARIYANVPRARHIAVVDKKKGQVLATWDVPRARANYPMALDEAGRRLFVGARSPAVLLVYDVDSGKVVATVPIGGDTDDLFFDSQRKRVYVVCGEGRVDVVKQESADRYAIEASLKTAPRARTGLFVPEERALYVAAPAHQQSAAQILVYGVR